MILRKFTFKRVFRVVSLCCLLLLIAGLVGIAVLGSSLGGAAALLASPPLKVDALIVEMVYPTIEEAVADRGEMVLGRFGRLLAPS